jgi:hypothetical protein
MLTLRRPEEIELAAPEELQRLRRRVAGMRRRSPAAAPAIMTEGGGAAKPAPAPPEPEAATAEESLSARLLETKRRRGSG